MHKIIDRLFRKEEYGWFALEDGYIFFSSTTMILTC